MKKKSNATDKTSKRGYARWKGISKEKRSAEMSRVAKKLWEKIRAGEMTKIDTQA